jgi:hypothetical protein
MSGRWWGALCLGFVGPVVAADGSEATIVLNAAEEPETQSWTEPASVNFTDSADAKDSWAVDVAGKYEAALGQSGNNWFVRGVVQKNTQLKKEVENYAAEIGAKFDLNSESGFGIRTTTWYLPTKVSLAWTDKTLFPDPKADCAAVPLPVECTKQEEQSLRASFSTLLFRSSFEDVVAWADSTHTSVAGPKSGWTHSLLPTVTVFYDDLIDAKLDAAGVEPDGHVLGAKVVLSAATSPAFSDYRLILSATLQGVFAFERSDRRKANFASDSTLIKLSADYELGQRSYYLPGPGWVPAIGISYTSGDDPLSGKLDQDFVMVGFKVTYRGE